MNRIAPSIGRVQQLEERTMPAFTAVGSEFRVNTFTANQQRYQAVDMDSDGDFIVVWTSTGQDGSIDGIYGQRYNALAAPQGFEFRVNEYTTNNQSNPSVAVDADGDFVVAWSSYGQDGQYDGVYARRYNAAGVAQGGEFRVNVATALNQTRPAVAIDDDGDFVVAWTHTTDGNGFGIFARRYDAVGTPVTGEFVVNVVTAGNQDNPAVAMDPVGNFVVTWESPQDGNLRGVYARRFDATGMALGSEFRVNTFTTNEQRLPAIGMEDNGDFVVTWQSTNQDGNMYGVYAQRYTSAGGTIGGEFRVNTVTTGQQALPAVAVDADGDFVIAWHGSNDGAATWGVYMQAYDADGIAQGGEVRGNTYTTNFQAEVAIAVDAGGDLIFTWNSLLQDGDSSGIYAQRFQDSVPPRVQSVQVNDGISQQRSQVTNLTVTFDQVVTLPANPATAFDLRRAIDNLAVGLSANVTQTTVTSVTLSFVSGAVDGTSLADGLYTLKALASEIAGGKLDGNGDGSGGDNYELIGTTANKLFRLFGDADGSGSVTASDFNAFRTLYGTTGNSFFDFDGDNMVTAADFNQFRQRYGVSL